MEMHPAFFGLHITVGRLPWSCKSVVTVLVLIVQGSPKAPDQVVMPFPAAELSQSPNCRWVLSTDTIWHLPVLAPCRFISRIKQTLDSIRESLLEVH